MAVAKHLTAHAGILLSWALANAVNATKVVNVMICMAAAVVCDLRRHKFNIKQVYKYNGSSRASVRSDRKIIQQQDSRVLGKRTEEGPDLAQ